MKTIENREDVSKLVHLFYDKIRGDKKLGFIFNGAIKEDQWPEHLEKLTDFWETNLFGIPKFKGNPMRKHRMLDLKHNHKIEMDHFGHWLQLWFATIDENFEGELANRAKEAARRMSTGLYLGMKNYNSL